MSWNLEGQRVKGMYIGEFPVEGLVTSSRVKYGGYVSHTVSLDNPIEVRGIVRHEVSLIDKEISDIHFIKEVA